MNQRRNQQGFTLMELMVVIVIVAILAAVAVPLYINYVKDAQRTEAKGAIAAIITAEQVFYQQSGTSPNATPTFANYDSSQPTAGQDLKVDLTEVNRNWRVTATADGSIGFTVNAVHSTDPDLNVCCTYTRTTGPDWDEGAACAGGGGGGAPNR